MLRRTRTVSEFRQGDRWLVPLPHPSWSGEAVMPGLSPRSFGAAEFWSRLGL
jgi:hypothetical protein